MREATWKDEDGRFHKVLLPADIPDSEARKGIPVGPPSLEPLNLPLEIEVRLHNQLYARTLFTEKDARSRRIDIVGALMGALKVDAERIVGLYTAVDN